MHSIGIIGCGGFADHHHKGFTETERAGITACYSRDREKRKTAAERWEARSCDSLDELMDAVDIVVLSTPGFARTEFILPAAKAGKHILCEKPLALNMDDALTISKAVQDAGITFMTGFNLRNDPRFSAMRKIQNSEAFAGTVSAWYRIHAPSSSSRWLDIEKQGHWRASNELSGGRVTEFGGHGVNWLLWTLGRPLKVYGSAMFVTPGFKVDDADYGIIECENGVGLLEIHRHAAVRKKFSCGIVGHGGSVELDDDTIHHTIMDGETAVIEPDASTPSKHAHFLDCVEAGVQPVNGVDEGLDTLKVCMAFNESVSMGSAIEIV